MGDFLQKLFELGLQWWPVRIIDAGCQGVKYKQDGTVELLQPGWHLHIPKLQRVEEVNVTYQNIDCGLQSLTTKDGVEITLSLNCGYSIQDAAVLYTTFQHFDTSLVNMARGHAAEIVCDTTWAELMEDPVGLAQEIQDALHEDVGSFGVRIEDVTADQLSRSKAFRLLQSQSV